MPILEVTDNIGIISFALSGLLISYRERLDILGLFIIMFLTALGGGIIRDILTDHIPYSFTYYRPTLLVLSVMFIGLLFKLHRRESIERNFWYILSDATGLISFAIAGAILALESGFNLFGIMFVALITAIGGGTLRDMMLNKIPFFLRTELYGSIALMIGLCIYLLGEWNILNRWSVSLLFVGSLSLRIVAYYRKWHLPKI
jgi:uncharacterized membrane protein YeiH